MKCTNCKTKLDDRFGKSLGCERCAGEFCSSACVDAHPCPAKYKNWQLEFGVGYGVPAEVDALVTDGLADDTSWHNDTCASFAYALADPETRRVTLYVEHVDVDEREFPDNKRFAISVCNNNDEWTYTCETDDVAEALAAFHAERTKLVDELRLTAITLAIDEAIATLQRLGRAKLEAIHATPEELQGAGKETYMMFKEDFDSDMIVDWDVEVADSILTMRELEESEEAGGEAQAV